MKLKFYICNTIKSKKKKKITRMGASPGSSLVKNPPANVGHMDSIPDPGRSHMLRSNLACAQPQLLSLCSRAQEPQLLKPVLQYNSRYSTQYRRGHCPEKPVHCN